MFLLLGHAGVLTISLSWMTTDFGQSEAMRARLYCPTAH